MKKIEKVEIKIYEVLGVKKFKKFVFKIRDILFYIVYFYMSKEERYNALYNIEVTNYNLGKKISIENVKTFKKFLLLNTAIHLLGLKLCWSNFFKMINGTGSLLSNIINVICIVINLYCIMLQRYNWIRMNQLVKKMTFRCEKQKKFLTKELKKEDSLLPKHTYKIIDKKENETDITLEEIIANANIDQLKQIRTYLSNYQIINKNVFCCNMNIPIKKNKSLKLELK